MTRTPAPLAAIAVALAALAGFVDAVVFVRLGGYFASFMSGNSTRLGVGLSLHDGSARWAAALILSFVTGVMLASVVARRFARRHAVAVMLGVTATLTLAAALDSFAASALAILLLAAAMGMENGVLTRDGEVVAGVSYMTGALVKFARALAGALMGDADRWAWLPHLALWLGFIAGAVWGARVATGYGEIALWVAAVVAGVITLATAGAGAAGRVKVVSGRAASE